MYRCYFTQLPLEVVREQWKCCMFAWKVCLKSNLVQHPQNKNVFPMYRCTCSNALNISCWQWFPANERTRNHYKQPFGFPSSKREWRSAHCLSCQILANQSKQAPWTNARQKVNSTTGKNINCSLKLLKFLRYFQFFVPAKGLSIILEFWQLFNDQEIKECLCSY